MRVTRSQIIHGVTEYIQNDILPKMGNGRAMQIIISVGANAVAANNKLADAIFEHQMLRAVLDDDGSGTYEIDGLMDAMSKSIKQYGNFPVQIPAIPLLSPDGLTLHLSADDIAEMRARIIEAV